MDVSRQQIFQDLRKQINKAKLNQSHILVYSFTGSGSSYLFKALSNNDNKLTYINSVDQPLGDYSLLDLPLSDAFTIIQKAAINQKCAILINNGLDFHSSLLEKLKSHLYLSFPICCRSLSDSALLAREINPNISDKNIDEIYKKSQGIGKIIKHLVINPDSISASDTTLSVIVSEVLSSLRGYSLDEIKAFGISFPLFGQNSKEYSIFINFDLSFTENENLSPQKLTPIESKILQKIISNQGQISKSEVSDIKWGENKYDEFSDQAINKSIRRLNSKLTQHTIKTIPKIGFILEKNAR
jgi:hypothetical protein